MMRVIATIVSLRWALTWSVLRKSVWQTIGYILGLLLAIGTVIGAAALAWLLGGLDGVVGAEPYARVLAAVVVLAGALTVLCVMFVQLLLIGDGATMGPHRFALYGIADRTLHAGLLASGLCGVPAICGLLSLLAWSAAYRWMGGAVVVAGVVSAPLAIVTMVSLSKMVVSLATTLVRSTRGRNIFYIAVFMVFLAVCETPSLLVGSGAPGERSFSLDALDLAGAVAGWTPLGAAFRIPFDVYAGDWPALAGHAAVLAATWVVCFMVSTWCLRHERMTEGARTAVVSAKGIGAFGWMPDSVSGSVGARLFTYLVRDPRQGLMFIFPLLFVVIFAVQSRGVNAMVWQGIIWGGLFVGLAEANGLAYDGRGWTMQVIAGVRGLDDRIGRVRVYAAIMLAYIVLLTALCFVVTGDWATVDGLVAGATYAAVAVAVAFCGLGVAEVISCVLMYPVPPIDKPFSTPQGRAVAQGLFPFAYLLATVVLMLPVGLAALALLLNGWTAYWMLIPISLVDGMGFLTLGSWLGGKLMDARMLTIRRTLDSFASLQK